MYNWLIRRRVSHVRKTLLRGCVFILNLCFLVQWLDYDFGVHVLDINSLHPVNTMHTNDFNMLY